MEEASKYLKYIPIQIPTNWPNVMSEWISLLLPVCPHTSVCLFAKLFNVVVYLFTFDDNYAVRILGKRLQLLLLVLPSWVFKVENSTSFSVEGDSLPLPRLMVICEIKLKNHFILFQHVFQIPKQLDCGGSLLCRRYAGEVGRGSRKAGGQGQKAIYFFHFILLFTILCSCFMPHQKKLFNYCVVHLRFPFVSNSSSLPCKGGEELVEWRGSDSLSILYVSDSLLK